MSKWMQRALACVGGSNVTSANSDKSDNSANSSPNDAFVTNDTIGICHTKKEIIPYDFQERAAIIEHEAGLPSEWAEAFAHMDCCQRPKQIPQERWQRIIHNTGLFLDRFACEAAAKGWTVADIFGVNASAPSARYDGMGLLALLGDNEIVAVEQDKIILRTPTGATQSFSRKHLPGHVERIMIWELP